MWYEGGRSLYTGSMVEKRSMPSREAADNDNVNNDRDGLVQKVFDSRITDSEFSSNCEFHDLGIVM